MTFAEAVRVLELPAEADLALARRRFRELAKRTHPDAVRGAAEKAAAQRRFQRVREAFDVVQAAPHLLERRQSRPRRPLPRQGKVEATPAADDGLTRWLDSGEAFRRIWAAMFLLTLALIGFWALLSWPR